MAGITVSLVKELRKRTGAGIMSCKKALVEASGNIELAIEIMRRSSAIKKLEEAESIVTDGLILTKIKKNHGFILEVNCQTDFVANNKIFQVFACKVLDAAITKKITDIQLLRERFETERLVLISKIGEKINIRRIAVLQGETVGLYQHGKRIGVLVAVKNSDKNLTKQLAMHIAASQPKFINPEDIPIETIEKERRIQLEIAKKSGKSKEIVERMVEGRIKKFIEEISFTKQPFIMNPSKLISQLLKEYNADVTDFVRFEVGEGIEKIKSDFAKEVITLSRSSSDK